MNVHNGFEHMHHGKQKMTTKEIHTNPDLAQELHGNVLVVDHIDKDNYKHYIGKTVKVIGDVDLSNLNLTKLPINFTEVSGNFNCSDNKLTTLEGAPRKVGSDFYCYENKLTSLVGAPKKVGGDFYCWGNRLTSLVGGPKEVSGFSIVRIAH